MGCALTVIEEPVTILRSANQRRRNAQGDMPAPARSRLTREMFGAWLRAPFRLVALGATSCQASSEAISNDTLPVIRPVFNPQYPARA